MADKEARVRFFPVAPKFWQDKVVSGWSLHAQYLALYLLTSPHRNYVGLYRCPLPYMAVDTKLTDAQVKAALKEIEAFAVYDYEQELVLVRKAILYTPPQTPRQVTGAIRLLKQLPRTFLTGILTAVAEKYPETRMFGRALRAEFDVLVSSAPVDAAFDPEPPAGPPVEPPKKEAKELPITAEQVAELWNETCSPALAAVARLSEPRKRKVLARIRQGTKEQPRDEAWWRALFERVVASRFLRGESERKDPEHENWRADFDWVMNETKIDSILIGRYDDAKPRASFVPTAPPQREVLEVNPMDEIFGKERVQA